jgi:hypothetical protein
MVPVYDLPRLGSKAGQTGTRSVDVFRRSDNESHRAAGSAPQRNSPPKSASCTRELGFTDGLVGAELWHMNYHSAVPRQVYAGPSSHRFMIPNINPGDSRQKVYLGYGPQEAIAQAGPPATPMVQLSLFSRLSLED